MLMKHWHILQVNESSRKTFSTLSIIDFRKYTSVKQIIGTNTIYSDKRLTEVEKNHHIGKIINFITYLLECHNCKIPYVDKSEAPFSIRLIKQRKENKEPQFNTGLQNLQQARSWL